MYDKIITREYNNTVIEYGILYGNADSIDRRILLVKVGQNGSIYGYRDKYLKMAERIHNQCGITVVIASNPFNGGNPLEDAMEVIKEYCVAESDFFEVLLMGHSNGAVIASWYAYKYPEISKMLLINMPIGVEYWHVTKRGIENFIANDGKIDVVYGEYDAGYTYIDLLRNMGNPNLETHVVKGEDHHFSFREENFLSLPERYLI